MLRKQKEYLDDIKNLKLKFINIGLDTKKLDYLEKIISSQELLLPVVGDFSAGKSSLLNSFIGSEKSILPTAITPETSIATELRFGTDERIEAVDKDGKLVKTYKITDFEEINRHVEEYSYLKLYLRNENIRSIEPLVLVDMPGFESPLDAHNSAIRKYLNRGAHFIVLISATDGTLHATSIRHLNDILEYNRDFSVVISKSNLVSQENLDMVKEKIRDDVDLNFGLEKAPVPVELDGSLAIKNIVSELNPDELFSSIVLPDLKDIIYQIESSLNIKIAAFNKNTNENDELISELKKSLEKITNEANEIKNTLKDNLIEQNVLMITDGIGRDLSSSVDSLVEIAFKHGQDALTSEIQDRLHSSLINYIKKGVKNISDTITNKFSVELSNLNSQLNTYCGEGDFIENITKNTLSIYGNNSDKESTLDKLGNFAAGSVYKTLTGLLAIVTNVLNPLIEIAIIVVPGIIKKFFDKKSEEKKREELRKEILTTVIPSLKQKLSSQLPSILEENVNKIIDEISGRYSSIIQEKQNEIQIAEKERAEKAAEIEKTVHGLQEAKEAASKFSKKLYA